MALSKWYYIQKFKHEGMESVTQVQKKKKPSASQLWIDVFTLSQEKFHPVFYDTP